MGVAILAFISSIGFVASIVGFLIAFVAVWLYRRGSGGVISRVGAWVVTAIVVFTLLLGIWVSLVVSEAQALGGLGTISDPRFWPTFNRDFSDLVGHNVLFIVLILAFGALGAFRTLGRAFAVARLHENPGSADDKTAPPKVGD